MVKRYHRSGYQQDKTRPSSSRNQYRTKHILGETSLTAELFLVFQQLMQFAL